MPFESLNYTRGVVIAHGKSELTLVRYISTNLHLPIKIFARNGGRSSIQIDGLSEILKKKPFKSLRSLANEYSVEYDKKNKRLVNFKLFIIMDTDDCDDTSKIKYISSELFAGHPLKDYIVPIYNITNLEDVMLKVGIMTKRVPDSEKGTYYSRIFPINTKPMSIDTVNQIRLFATKISKTRQTNMLEFVEYCFEQIPDNLWEEGDENTESRKK